MPMIPGSLILLILSVAFVSGAAGFFLRIPHVRLLNWSSVLMGVVAALMFVTILLPLFDVEIVWLSWVLLVIAIMLVGVSIPMLRWAMLIKTARERANAQRRAQR